MTMLKSKRLSIFKDRNSNKLTLCKACFFTNGEKIFSNNKFKSKNNLLPLKEINFDLFKPKISRIKLFLSILEKNRSKTPNFD